MNLDTFEDTITAVEMPPSGEYIPIPTSFARALLRVARALQDLDTLIDFSVPLDSAPMEFSDRTSMNAAMAKAHAALAALEEPTL